MYDLLTTFSPTYLPLLKSLEKRILVIEDDTCMKTIISKTALSLDSLIRIDWAPNSHDATKLLNTRKYIGVLADIILPGNSKSGIELWNEYNKKSNTPFIIMSALAANMYIKRFHHMEKAPPFLPKPFRISELKAIIETHFFDATNS